MINRTAQVSPTQKLKKKPINHLKTETLPEDFFMKDFRLSYSDKILKLKEDLKEKELEL